MSLNRRRHFFINKPLQLRYMLAVLLPLFVISMVAIFGFYIGIWSKVLSSFSDEGIRNDLLTASRIVEYENARHPSTPKDFSMLSFFTETEKLSQRQREIFKDILDDTNKTLLWKFLLLAFLVGWGTIYISHKIAGPLYRFSKTLNDVQKGNYRARVFLRKGDEGHPVAKEFNDALEATDRLLSDIKNASRDPNQEQALARIKDKLNTITTSADV